MTAEAKTCDRRRDAGIRDVIPRCSSCDEPNDRLPNRYCKACHNTYQKRWAAEQRELARQYRKLFHVTHSGSIET